MSENSKVPIPGEAALQNMKLLKSESTVFKVPKIPQTKGKVQKSKVLDEDEYVEGIAKIIQRDFFPDLEKLKAQNEYLEATENKDYARLREIAQKYSGNRPPTEPYNSPATFDTPDIDRPSSPTATRLRASRSATPQSTTSAKLKDITDNHSLDSFLAKHTSEDNASYDKVISLENKKKAGKLDSQWESEVTSQALVDAALALPSIERQADQTEKPNQVDTWRFKAKNYIMYVPDGAASQLPPPKPELVHQNTRLVADPFDHTKNKQAIEEIAKSQDASVAGRIGVDGATLAPVARYGLVSTPSPRPGVGESPLMTWGEIEGTPFSLDASDTPVPHAAAGAAYKMLECGARERIALQLAEQVARKRRPTTPLHRLNTPSFRTNTERLASMSPAARKLAAKHLLSPRLKLTPNDVGIAHLPSPKRTPSRRQPLVTTPNVNVKTPVRIDSDRMETLTNNTLTDNLLQINVAKRSRLKAQDFFQ